MTEQNFSKVVDDTIAGCKKLLQVKGHDYSGMEDRLLNFKRAGKRAGMTPRQALLIYLIKHLDAIETFCRDGQVKSEPIDTRIQDAINYMFLLQAMVKEDQETEAISILEEPASTAPYLPDHFKRGDTLFLSNKNGNYLATLVLEEGRISGSPLASFRPIDQVQY